MKKEVVINERIPSREKVAYGIGGFMDGGGVSLMSCIMLKYMTTMGVAMAVASTIMTVAKLWDAVTDPLMGIISDNTRSRWGRRKPYMFIGGVGVILTLLIMFMPVREWGMSIGGFTAFILIMYLVWNTVSTISQVPYCSMSSDISPSFKERNNANTVKLIFTSIASGLAYALPLLLIEALISKDGYLFMPNISSTTFWLCIALIFGILFGGSKGSDRLETDGCVFVYLYAEDGVVYLAADIVAEGQRVALGEPVTTAIAPAPADPANPDLITLELTGRLNGSIDVSLSVNGGEKENHTFSSEEHKVFLENRFAFLMNGEESADIGRVRLKYVKVDNKWSYHIEDTAAKSVAQNFDAVDEDGVPYINEEDMFIINQHGGYAADTEAGVYVKDGELKFVAGGQGSGLAVRHAYDNWKMTFDITDMQRQVLYAEDGETVIRTVCNAPITICFGMYAEGVGYTTGKAITLNFATTLDGKTVIHTTDPGYETSIGFSSDVLKSEIIGLATVGGTKIKEGFARHQFIDPALDGYTIRVQVEFNNGRLTCGYVVLGLEDYDLLYDPILIYENVDGEGYVGITTTHNLEGSFSGTFSIDNFKVVDTDDNSIIEDDTVPQETEPTPPVTPVDPGNDGGGKDNTVPVAIITGVSALCVGVAGCWLVIHFVNRKKANKT